jgi:uncharacterized membrane protein YdjX (TVP38/TMEM64 family)
LIVWVLLCLPGTIVDLLAGFIFGFPVGLLTVFLSKNLAANIAFFIGRVLGADVMAMFKGGPITSLGG